MERFLHPIRFHTSFSRVAFAWKVVTKRLHILPPVFVAWNSLYPILRWLACGEQKEQLVYSLLVRILTRPWQWSTIYRLIDKTCVLSTVRWRVVIFTNDVTEGNWGVLCSRPWGWGNNWRTSLPNRSILIQTSAEPAILLWIFCPSHHDTASEPWLVPVPYRVASRSCSPSYLLPKVVPRYDKNLLTNGATL